MLLASNSRGQAAKHFTMHKKAPHSQELPNQTVNGAAVNKS